LKNLPLLVKHREKGNMPQKFLLGVKRYIFYPPPPPEQPTLCPDKQLIHFNLCFIIYKLTWTRFYSFDAFPTEKMILITGVNEDTTFMTFGNRHTDDTFKVRI
jgi:hypothetical protein